MEGGGGGGGQVSHDFLALGRDILVSSRNILECLKIIGLILECLRKRKGGRISFVLSPWYLVSDKVLFITFCRKHNSNSIVINVYRNYSF